MTHAAADPVGERLRAKSVRVPSRELLISLLTGSSQEADLQEPTNCDGVGRVRHFRRRRTGWPDNPLPIDPARTALGLPAADEIEAQVFQLGACNWRCWYCFVPYELLRADERSGQWITPAELVGRYLREPDPPRVLVLSGGQPDLVPEWPAWTLEALREAGQEHSVFLWSDDNLGNDFLWRYVSDAQIAAMAGSPMYGRVGCFKGFDEESFHFNTGQPAERFGTQFEVFRRLLASGFDMHAYATITTPTVAGVDSQMERFVDRLQLLDERLPLRTVPLLIEEFTPVEPRVNERRRLALAGQRRAADAWEAALSRRFGDGPRAIGRRRAGP